MFVDFSNCNCVCTCVCAGCLGVFLVVFVMQLGEVAMNCGKPPHNSISLKIVGHVKSMYFRT